MTFAADLGLPDTFWEEFAAMSETDVGDMFHGLEEDEGPVEWALDRALEILGGDNTG